MNQQKWWRRRCRDCNRRTTAIRCDRCRMAAINAKRDRVPWEAERLGPNHRALPFILGLAERDYGCEGGD
jgi:hypothetical protein